MSTESLRNFLNNVDIVKNEPIHKPTGKKIGACVPMHTFGFPVDIEEITLICKQYNIPVIEDAAESLGSTYKNKPTGTFGLLGTYSFNGNKTITCGGGGIIVTNNDELGRLAKHLTTQAKVPHKWEYVHDYIGYNYRCPNLNAALACAQLEKLDVFIDNKRETAKQYKGFFNNISEIEFISEPTNSRSNYWLNTILVKDKYTRDEFLKYTNSNGVMTRPAWTLMNNLEMFKECIHDDLAISKQLENRIVNIPSSVRL
jgi:perosamine synthetase